MTSTIRVEPHPQALVQAGTLAAETYADASNRQRIAFDSKWFFQFDFQDRGLKEMWYEPHASRHWAEIDVPGTWDLHFIGGFNKQAVGWYALPFTVNEQPGKVVKLHFDGVFREAMVWLNGVALGRHVIPYLPFQFDVTHRIDYDRLNTLVVRIDDRIRRLTLPCSTVFTPRKHGWFPYGGLLRPVYLETNQSLYVAQAKIDTTLDGTVQARLLLEHVDHGADTAQPYRLKTWITDGSQILHTWPEQTVPPQRSEVVLTGVVPQPHRWSPETPQHRYHLVAELTNAAGETEHVGYDFAFRTFEAHDQRFFLNGQDTYLRGINRHEDHPDWGPIFKDEVLAREVALLKALNVNFIRSGHYPNDVRVLKALEAAGIMIVEEIPVYQLDSLQLVSRTLRRLARQALQHMIIRDYNRPGIVMWSVANEIHSWFPMATRFVRSLREMVNAEDPHRPVMLARVTWPAIARVLDHFDRSCAQVDVVGINQYIGWYFGKTHQAAKRIRQIHQIHPDKTWLISEYGAGALLGRQLPMPPDEEPTGDHSYSEAYQAYFHRQHLTQFLELPFIRGIMPWVLCDFRMEWSPNTGKPHPLALMNLKGLANDARFEKEAFYQVAEVYEHVKDRYV